jgi:DNA modification methylase
MNKSGFTSWQPILFYGKDSFLATGKGARMDVIQDAHIPEAGIDHPCPKPIHFVRKLVERATANSSALVFDPFMGSGTTGVACMQLGRNFIGCEIDPKYFAIAEKRIKAAAAQEVMFR